MHLLGAALTAGGATIPSWGEGLNAGKGSGGLLAAVFAPTGAWGKILLVLMGLATPSASAPTMYTVCTSLMTVSPIFARVPRAFIAIVSTAMYALFSSIRGLTQLTEVRAA